MRRREQPEVCDRCGGEAVRPATGPEQLRHWFTHGAGAGTAWHCRECGASWSTGSGYGVLYHASGPAWRRRARLPLDVLRALRGARSWHPVPAFYAAMGGAALVPAVAVAVLTRVRWWVALVGVPVAAVVGAFLGSLASAVGRGRRDLLWRLAPDRAWRRDFEEELAGLREQGDAFALLVPDGWPGGLSIDGGDWSIPRHGPRVLQEVTVVADQGDPLLDPDRDVPGWRTPTPRVEIHCTRHASVVLLEDEALREFVDRAFPESPLNFEGIEQASRQEVERRLHAARRDHERQRQRLEPELAHRWRDGGMRVDGVAIPARLLTHDDADIGVATFVRDGQGVLVIAEGIDLDTLALARVADPTPLVDEFELRRRRMFTQWSG